MKNSPISAGTGNAALRLMLPAILASSMAIGCGPQGTQVPQGPQGSQGPQGTQAAPSSQYSLVGQWRTTIQGSALAASFSANGQYLQVITNSDGSQTGESGPYSLFAPNTVSIVITDWSPKTRMMFVPNPTCGVPGVTNPTNPKRDSCLQWQEMTYPKPPDAKMAYVFNGPNSMSMTDEVMGGGALVFTRVTGQ